MKKSVVFKIAILAVVLSAIYTVYTFQKLLNSRPLPVLGQVSNFELIDRTGAVFSPRQLEGKAWIANFIFTKCTDVCPLMTKNMKSLYESFKLERDVALVSITIDPEKDTPEVLDQYAQSHKVNVEQWRFLTGDREQVRDVIVNKFKLKEDLSEHPHLHSSHFILVDQYGFIRGYYDGTDKESVAQIFKDTAYLIKWK